MKKDEILRRLEALPYDREEYWVLADAARVLRGLADSAAEIRLGCLDGMGDVLQAEGLLRSGSSEKRGQRVFRIGPGIRAHENWLYGGLDRIGGFQVISEEGLKTMEDLQIRSWGLDPEKVKEFRTEHYRLYALEGSKAEREIGQIGEIQEDAWRKICGALRTEPDFPIRFYLLNTREQVGRIHTGHVALNGFCRPPDMAFAVYNDLRKACGCHEVAHLISRLAGRPDRDAVEEGLAVYFDGNWWGIPLHVWVLYWLKTGRYMKLEELLDNGIFRFLPDHLTYSEAGSFTQWLIESRGMEKYLEFYRIPDSREGFRKVYGTDAAALNGEYLEDLSGVMLSVYAEKEIEERIRRYCGGGDRA